MQPRAEEINRVLTTFVQGKHGGPADGSRRRSFGLVVQGSSPLHASIRELRGNCAMIDIGSSIFTLAYLDILGIDPVSSDEGGLLVTVRPGCFASHVAARLRRAAPRPWSGRESSTPLQQGGGARVPQGARDDRLDEDVRLAIEGGIAESDPAGTGSARHEVVGNDALRIRRR